MLNAHLWSVYQIAIGYSSIKALLLYDFDEGLESSYKFIVISNAPKQFFIDSNWLNKIDPVLHIEKEHSFYDEKNIYLNCCAIFKTGWSAQFIFIKDEKACYFFKQQSLMVLIDRNGLIKSEMIRYEAIVNNQWYQLPTEMDLNNQVIEFHEGVLKSLHQLRIKEDVNVRLVENHALEKMLIHLVQWLSSCGECLLEEELTKIKELLSTKEGGALHFNPSFYDMKLNEYLELCQKLIVLYAESMNYRLLNTQVLLLKEYINLLLKEECCVNTQITQVLNKPC